MEYENSGESIKVQKKIRPYGIVHESLIEDIRLSPTARLVATWLCIRPVGWEVWRNHLLEKLGIGKSAWLGARGELIKVGYLRVSGQGRVVKGRFGNVKMEFSDEPDLAHDLIKKESDAEQKKEIDNKLTVARFSVPRSSGDGQPLHIPLTPKTLTKKPQLPLEKNVVVVEIERKEMHWPGELGDGQVEAIIKILNKMNLSCERGQQVVDELAGSMKVKGVKNPVGWVRKVAEDQSPIFDHADRVKSSRVAKESIGLRLMEAEPVKTEAQIAESKLRIAAERAKLLQMRKNF